MQSIVQNRAQSKLYQMIANRLIMLVETNPRLSKNQLIDDTCKVLQLDQSALELAYELVGEVD